MTTTQWYVRPEDPNFGDREETMGYDVSSNGLSPIRALYSVKSAESGGIRAHLEAPASLFNGRTTIPLTVTFNGVPLTDSPQQVVDAAEARAELVIAAAPSPGRCEAGDYTAVVAIVFESTPESPSGVTPRADERLANASIIVSAHIPTENFYAQPISPEGGMYRS
ncbi:CS1 type fimbrial major subunit [Streptomyces sp. NRRL S-495]|uniref:CS1 type fimbrial major subunit n=1 Tax=Streptomyces sp. NRRL S-495 TaxID=1609133 RepID=UPI000696D7BA|nr:CS1 type fimbrial major subunit [Streptomyces sp. NRRL S-495]